MSEVIGSVQVVVRPDTKGFAEKARDGIEREFRRKNVLEIDFESDPDNLIGDLQDSLEIAQKYLDLKKNKLKVNVGLDWRKNDIATDLKRFKTDVEALQQLHRPTVVADFEVSRRGLEAIQKDVKLNVGLDTKALERAIGKATKDVTVFGDKKAIEKETRKVAEISRAAFQEIFTRRRLKLEIDADTKKLEQAQVAMENALGIAGRQKDRLQGLEDSLSSVTKEIEKQTHLTQRLNIEWLELEDSGEANARQISYYANELRDAEDSLKNMVREQDRLRRSRDHQSNNIVDPSIAGADRLRREFELLEEELEGKKVEIGAVAERSSFAALSAELQALTRDRLVVVYTKMNKAGIGIMERQWASISRSSSNLVTNSVKWMGQLTGIRVLWHTFKDMVEWLPRLDMMVPQLAQKVALFGTGTAGAIGGLGVLVNLLSDVAEVGKGVLFLPTLLAGTAGSALILGRAFQDFEKTFPAIVDFYKELGNIVSDKVWERAAEPIRRLHDATSGLLTNYVPQWASAWGDALGALTTGIGSGTSLRALEDFLQNSIDGTENATKGWESLGSAVMTMVGAGSSVLPDLGTWFSDTMEDFDKWAKTNSANGNIDKWTREAGTALRELGSVMVSTVKIFGNLSKAFKVAGFPGLTELALGMERLATATQDLSENGEFMFTLTAVRDFFSTMGDTAGDSFEEALSNAWIMIGKSLNRLAEPIAGALDAIFDGFNSDKFQDGFDTFIDGMGSFLEDITPGIEALTADLGSLLGVVGTAGKSWGPAFNDMLLMFSSAGDKLHPGLTEFIENTGPALQDLVKDITPHVEDFAEAISDLLGNENFQEFVTDMIGSLGTLLGWLLDLGTGIVNLTEDFADWYGSLDEGQQDTVRWAGIMGAAFAGLGLAIGGLALKIAPGATLRLFARGLVALAKGAGRFVANFVRSIAGLGMLVGRALAALGRGIVTAFKKLKLPNPAKLLAPIGKFFKRLPGALGKLIPKVAGGIFKKFLPQILKLLGGPLGWLLLLRDAVNLIKPVGVLDFVDMILDKLGLGDSWVAKVLRGLSDNIEKAFGADVGLFDLINPLSNMVTKAWDGMVEGFKADGLWGGIKGFFAGLGEGFLDHFQLAWNNLKSVIESFAPQGVIDFFDDPWGKIWEWLTGGEGETTASFMSAPSEDIPKIAANIENALRDLWEDIKAALNKAFDWLDEVLAVWEPTTGTGKFFHDLLERVPGLLGFDDEGNFSWDTMADSWVAFGEKMWEEHIKPWLGEQWDKLVEAFKEWEPVAAVIAFIDDPVGTILRWLGLKALELAGNIVDSLSDWATDAWNGIRDWLQTGWDNLVAWIKGWSPPSLFSILGWIASKLGDWLAGGATGLAGGLVNGVGGVLDWGAKKWTDGVKPWLDKGWETLKGGIDSWNPEGSSGLGSAIDRAIGTDDGSAARTSEKLTAIGGRIGTFAGATVAQLAGMGNGGRREIEGLADTTDIEFGRMESSGSSRTSSMSGDVVGNMLGMKLGGVAQALSLATGTSGQFSSMSSSATSKSGGMKSSVVSNMGSMQAQAVAKAAAMQVQVIAKMARMKSSSTSEASRMSSSVVAQARHMQAQFVAQMATMSRLALGVASRLRGSLVSALSINASGAGRHTGSTFVSGLSGALSRAVGVARGMAGRIRSALSFSVYSSGSSVGGSFASGIQSRVGSVAAAANALARAARARMPNSPADEGPFSGNGWGGWGESIADELARGLKMGAPAVAKEAEKLMGGVGSAFDASHEIAVSPSASAIRGALKSDIETTATPANAGNTINVNVQSNAEDPLEDGARMGRDLVFAMRGEGLA